MVETARDFAGQLHMHYLILAHRHLGGVINKDVRALQQRITEKAVGGQVLLLKLLLLILVGRDPLEPAQRRDHGEQQVQLGMLRHLGLDKQLG